MNTTSTPSQVGALRKVFAGAVDGSGRALYFPWPRDVNVNFDRDAPRLDGHSWMFDTAAEIELAGSRARGGKQPFVHGMADPIFSPLEMIDDQQRLHAWHGAATSGFARRNRPLCPYPQYAHYEGSGNPEDAANFSYRAP
jgi:hypothetical protein